ncbi:MAG: hypothetical protein QM523_01230 [Candidatus Pacebacteria bacterium]|nr:hypothetical protein [Candidatus Paceibacterota bacterium]
MEKSEVILVTMAALGEIHEFTPTKIQKLIFIIDREAKLNEQNKFNFIADSYGPFDMELHDELKALQAQGLLRIKPFKTFRTYSLTEKGMERGVEIAKTLTEEKKKYLHDICDWVAAADISNLTRSVFNLYPEMAVNWVFNK